MLLNYMYFLRIVYTVTVNEYERVEGWEGSDAVSPLRDGAAWTLKNGRNFEGLRALQRCPCSYSHAVYT